MESKRGCPGPCVPRLLPVASDTRTALHIGLIPTGEVRLSILTGRTAKASWFSVDGLACRLDGEADGG